MMSNLNDLEDECDKLVLPLTVYTTIFKLNVKMIFYEILTDNMVYL